MVTAQEILETLRERGCELWADGDRLRARMPRGGLDDTLREAVGEHKQALLRILAADGDKSDGRRLLRELWDAGYEIRLERSRYGEGFIIVPVGQTRPGTDFPRLYRLYEKHHDEAVSLLVETCRLLGIPPEKWHEQAPRKCYVRSP